jgi:HAD superfamily hydrolase (TIGR01549 family)
MITNLKAILFDIDDTLFDRDKAQREVLHLIVREFHDIFTGIDKEMIAEAFSESDRIATQEYNAGASIDVARTGRSRRFLKILGLSEDYADRITAMYIKSYPGIKAPVRRAKFVLGKLAKKFQLAVISNGSPDVQYRKLAALGIKHLFDCIILSEEVGIRKPDPGIFRKATALLVREPEECLSVGNSYDTDILGAKRVGMPACWFNPHGLRLSSVDIKPDFEISALSEIFRILDYT